MKGMSSSNWKSMGVVFGVFVLAVSLFVSVPANAQVVGATLSGTVTDPSGGVVVNATITATNSANASVRTVMSDSAGFYSIPNLIPGAYEVKVTATGFSTAVQNLTLAVAQQQQVNFTMQVGATTTTVQVTEAAPQIDLTSSAVSGQVESETVRELPLNGRDWTSLAVLQPGVKQIETQMAFATSARGNRGFGGELTVSGQRSTFNNYRIDGLTINDYAMAGPGDVVGLVLGVDAVEEFQVLTGGFPAEYGRATGGVVNAISRSGTNTFHGSIYEFLRNSALDSNDYFDRAAGAAKPPFKRNQFGATAGGPIKKDKLFFFADYEGLRQTKGIPSSTTVFSNNAQNGFLAGPVAAKGLAKGTPCTLPDGTTGEYVGTMANTCYSTYAASLLPLWPIPNGAVDPKNPDRAIFVFAGTQAAPENFGTSRIDYKIGNNDTLNGTFLRDEQNFTQPDGFNDVGSVSSTSRTNIVLQETHTFGSSFVNAARVGFNRDHVLNDFTPTAINPLAGNTGVGAVQNQNAPRLSVRGGVSDFNGGANVGSRYLHIWNSYQYYDDAIWTHGNHTVKFGGGAERMLYNEHSFQNPGGRYIFGNGYTTFLQGDPTHFEAGLLNVVDFPREFRQTTFGAYVQDDWKMKPNLTVNLGIRYEPTTVLSDAQGRITNLPTITSSSPTCGTAFSLEVPPYNVPPGGATSCGSVGPYYNNPTTKNFEPRIGFAWDPFKNGKTSVRGSFGLYDVDPFAGYFLLQQNQEGPFVLFKSVTGDPSITGNGFVNDGGGAALVNPALPAKLSASTVEGSPRRSYVDEWGLTIQRQITSDVTLTVGYVGSHGLHLITRGDDGNMNGAPGSPQQAVVTPYGYLFPCGPDGKIKDGPCVPGFASTGTQANPISNRLNPNLGVVRYIYWNGSSNYNGLDVNLEKRFSHGLQFQVAYTFAKSQDDTSQTIAGDTFGNGINSPWWWLPQAFYGPSDFNVAHSLSINALYTIPTPKSWSGVMKEALADWELGGIFSFNSGTPTTAINAGDPLGLGNGGADQFGPLVRLPGCDPIDHGYAGSAPGAPQWINTNCFAEPSVPGNAVGSIAYGCAPFSVDSAFANNPNNNGVLTKGGTAFVFDPTKSAYCANLSPFNVGRNSITGPHLVDLDFSVHKTFPIKERLNLQFRAEFFNITNHDNFVPPQPNSGDTFSGIYNQNGTSAGAGFISTYSNPQQAAREMQFALKLQW